jgi:hypothetical protein
LDDAHTALVEQLRRTEQQAQCQFATLQKTFARLGEIRSALEAADKRHREKLSCLAREVEEAEVREQQSGPPLLQSSAVAPASGVVAAGPEVLSPSFSIDDFLVSIGTPGASGGILAGG